MSAARFTASSRALLLSFALPVPFSSSALIRIEAVVRNAVDSSRACQGYCAVRGGDGEDAGVGAGLGEGEASRLTVWILRKIGPLT